ncbi:hypothetical protein R3W88_033273 [Solanum pinnatisectum]|uniref:Uncharacterized protein n=1 Tax=Solanum pinnatisectum TaxID=50273 RepID=A0AAV9K396_9SOLN|nr:hypothetical protein R3W88_033273 [Solanum pinnatisectum]
MQSRPAKLIESICNAGISKSWKCVSRKCDSITQSPWLDLSNEPQYYCKTQQHTFNFSFEQAGCYRWNGRRRARYDLGSQCTTIHLVSEPMVVGLLGRLIIKNIFISKWWPLAFVVYQVGKNQKWMKQESSQNGLIDPNNSSMPLSLKGTFYALSLQGTMLVIEEENQFHLVEGKPFLQAT